MKITIRDRESLIAIPPLEAIAYLKAEGWNQTRFVPGKFSVWQIENSTGDQFEVALPLSAESPDYATRAAELLATLEAHEQRSQQAVYHDLLTSSADVVRIKVGNGDLPSGEIPLEEGVGIVDRARDLFWAASCSAIQPRKVLPKRKPDQAGDFMRKLKLGQTERGSYVVTIHSRVPPQLGQLDMMPSDPYERQVTALLSSSLVAARSAAEEAAAQSNLQSFENAVELGVSANLCDALAGLCNFGENRRRVEVGFSWARTRPAGPHLTRSVKFNPDSALIFSEVARQFRATSPQDDFELLGNVVSLKRRAEDTVGKVTVVALLDEKPITVVLDLSDPDYHVAVSAHDKRLPIRCSGSLVREGKSFSLRNPDGFSVIEDNE